MILVSKKPQMDGSSAAICKKNDGLEALLPRYEELIKVKRREVSSKKAEINEAERVAQPLKDEIQSLHGPGRASAIFNVALLEEDIGRKKEQAAQIIPNLEATTEQKCAADTSYRIASEGGGSRPKFERCAVRLVGVD